MDKKWLAFMMGGLLMCVPVFSQNDILESSDLQVIASLLADDSDVAKEYAEKIIKKDKENTDLIAAIGTVFLRAEKLEDATAYFNRAQRCKRISVKAINLGGDIARMKNQLDSAQYYYGRSMYFDRKNPEAYYKYANLMKNTDVDKAITALNVLKVNRPDINVDKKIAGIYYTVNNIDKAVEVYQTINVDSLDDEDLIQYALSLFLKKDYEKSLEFAALGHKRSMENPVFDRLMLYNNTELNDYDAAVNSANDLFYHSKGAKYQYQDYIYYGYALNGLGKTQEAIEQFNIALQKNADEPSIKKQIAEAYARINDYDKAIKYYTEYLASLKTDDANRAYDLYQLGRLYWKKGIDNKDGDAMTLEKTDALNQANKVFGELATLRPDSYLGYYWQAKVNTLLDPEYKKGLAKPYFLKAAELLEKSGESKEQLIECYKQISYYYYIKKELNTAVEYAYKIQGLDPDDEYAKQMISTVRK